MSRRLTMRKISEVLRLNQCNLSKRAIAESIGVSPSTVSDYIRRAQSAGLTYPLPLDMDESALERKLYPDPIASRVQGRPMPDWSFIHRELGKKHVTLELLWQEYKAIHPDGVQYSSFCEHYRVWRGTLSVSMRQTHAPGDRLFVDYAGTKIPVTDPQTGEVKWAEIFVAVLGASNYTYAEATWSQTIPDWLGSHVRTFEFLGGVMHLVVPDNLKSGVTLASFYDPEINPSYQEFASHYGTAILPARVRKPKDKAKVEGAVLIVSRWIIAALRNRRFFSLAELNEAIAELINRLNLKPFKKLPGNRKKMFEQIDQPALRPLPPERYEFADWLIRRVAIDYHVEIESHYYSVPFRLAKQKVQVRVSSRSVEVFVKGQRVASHPKSSQAYKQTTLAEHMPRGHQEMLEWNAGRFTKWAYSIGPNTECLINKLLRSKSHEQQSYRACLGVLRFSASYGNVRLEAACLKALELNAVSYRTVSTILKNGMESTPSKPKSPNHSIDHPNVRGPDYYH